MQTELPNEWSWSRIGDQFTRITRKNDAGCDRVLTASGEHGLIDQREFFNKSVAGRDLSSYYHLKKGEFAYNRSSMTGYPVGAIKRLNRYDEGVLSTLYLCFAPRPDASIDSDFAAHLFDSQLLNTEIATIAQVGARAHGLLNVKASDFMEVALPLPPLPEQKKIAAILSSVDEAIRATEALIEQTRRVKEGLLQELLTRGIGHTRFKKTEIGEIPESWEVRPLGEISTIKSGATPKRSNPGYWGGNIPWIKTAQIRFNTITSADEFITDAGVANSSAQVFPAGTVLMAMYGQGATRGRVAILGIDATTNQACAAFTAPTTLPKFLYHTLSSMYQELRLLGREGTQKNLSAALLRQVRVAVPPRREQQLIVDAAESFEARLAMAHNELAQLADLKSGLLQDLLTGTVRVAP